MDVARVSVIVPASGLSTRFGEEDKLQAPFGGGTVLSCVVDRAVQLRALEVIVVSVRDLWMPEVRLILNPAPERGLGYTIAIGARAASPEAEGFLVWPADMPSVKLDTVAEVLNEGGFHRAVRPTFQGSPGHPAFIGGAYRAALETLDGDQGAKSVIRDWVHLTVADPGSAADIDTAADYRREARRNA